MSRTLGVEVGADRLRAVVGARREAPHTFELPFTPERLDDAVAELRTLAGDVTGIGLAIGLAHLHVKQVKLPPVDHLARRQMLMVEPERFFAVPSGRPAAIALDAAGTIAFGADGEFVDACVRAFTAWAPVQRVEAAPMALARTLIAAGHDTGSATLDAAPGEVGLLQLDAGAVRTVRRVRAADLDVAAASPIVIPGIDAAFAVAQGASLRFDGALDAMLLTPTLERTFTAALRRRLVGWSVASIAAVCAVVWSIGVARERTLAALQAEVAAARVAARDGSTAMLRVLTIDRELQGIGATTATRADALASLAALGVRLPQEAVAQRVRMVGAEWQVEGNAEKASAVLAALAAEPTFEKVRFLAPSNRFRDGTDDRETFAIAFAVR